MLNRRRFYYTANSIYSSLCSTYLDISCSMMGFTSEFNRELELWNWDKEGGSASSSIVWVCMV